MIKTSMVARLKFFYITIIATIFQFCIAQNSISNPNLSTNPQPKIIASYDGDVINRAQPVVFNNEAYFINMLQDSKDNYSIVTTKFSSDYQNILKHSKPLPDLIGLSKSQANNFIYYLEAKANDQGITALITAHNSINHTSTYYLLQTTNGESWSLNKSFATTDDKHCANTINASGDLISVSCDNNDEAKNFYFSTNNGNSWNKTLPSDSGLSSLSPNILIANNRFFSMSFSPNGDDVTKLYYTDGTTPFVESYTENLRHVIVHNKNSIDTYEFSSILNIFPLDGILIAQTEYKNISTRNNRDNLYEYFFWLSHDNGNTWELASAYLPNQVVTEIKRHQDLYYLISLGQGWSNDKLYYYSVNAHDLIHHDHLVYTPIAVFDHSTGYMLDHRSPLKTLLIFNHYDDYNNFRIEFTKI